MDQSEFLAFVLGEPVKDYPVAVEQWTGGNPKPQSALLSWEKLVEQPIEGANAFFLPRLESVQGITTIASDTDDREVQLRPSISVETAEGRRNSYWRLLEPVTESQAETLLSFLDPHSPPPNYTRMFRLPGTFSSKHGEEQPFQCHVVDDSGAPCTVAQIMALEPPAAVVEPVDDGWLTDSGGPFAPNDWIAAVKFMADRNVARSVKIEIERPQANAAKMLYSLLRSGCTEKEAIWIVEASPCNPFRSWRYGVRTELAKLLVMARSHLRAVSVASAVTRIRADRADKRKPFVIRADASKTALVDFKQQMTVLHASDGTKWAVEKRTGIAMPLVRGSSPIAHYINTRYGINPVDVDHHHVLEDMMAYAASRPPTAEATSISYYDRARNIMLVSFGGKEVGVLEAGSDRLTFQENGAGGIIFRPVVGADVLATRSLHVERALQAPPGFWWNQIAPPETLQNLSRGDPEELSTLLHVWTIFVLFRNIAESRPILSCLGPMGSGKSTLSKKLHLLFYGRGVKLFQTTTIDDWNTVTSNYPLCLFDNVDAPTPWWLPPKLAISISPTDSVKRALFSNNDPYTRRCDAMIGVSSHDPSFLKEDVIDRMILAQFRRIDAADRLSESEMLNQVAGQREALVAGLLADALRTLSTPKPATIGSAIRIVDFAVIGGWIAKAIGKEDAFRAAIGDLAARQHSRILEEDSVLVASLELLQADGVATGKWLTHSQLWSELLGISDDEGETIKRIYKGPLQLGRKLQAIATELRDAVGLEQQDDPIHGWPTFKIPSLPEPNHQS